jgi:hypothetical protein
MNMASAREKIAGAPVTGEHGYAGNGLGKWTRVVSRPGGAVRSIRQENKITGARTSALTLMIEQQARLADLKIDLHCSAGSQRKKLLKQCEIKAKFIAKLKAEIDAR